jgi:hypothetical protein
LFRACASTLSSNPGARRRFVDLPDSGPAEHMFVAS